MTPEQKIPEEIKTKIKAIVQEKYSEKNDSFIHNRYLDYCCGYSLSIAGRSAGLEREKELEEFLKAHEKWEAAVISEDSMWWPKSEKDALNGKIYDSFLELQLLRNKLLGKYQDGQCNHGWRYYQDKRVCHSCGHTVYGDFRD